MLSSDQITYLQYQSVKLIAPVVDFLIAEIARRIAEAGKMTSTAAYQVWRLQQLGVSQRQLKKELRKRLQVSHRELRQLITNAAEAGYSTDISRFPFVQAVPFVENQAVQNIVRSAVNMAGESLENLTQTMGFVAPNGKAAGLTDAFQQACDFAFEKVSTGAQDYNSAVREAVKGLAEKGIQTIDYESGVHTSLEAAVRRNVMGSLGLMQEQISQQNHDDLGCDGWEISAHAASAPDHEPIQGKQYGDKEFERLNNSLVRRIGTLNCGHAASPIILGVNSPQYTTEELETFRQENEKGVDYAGRHYTMYEATQRQRQLERGIRNRKRRILVDEATGDKDRLPIDQTRYVALNDEYKRFSKAAGLRVQHDRMEMPGFGPKQAESADREWKNAETAHKEWLKSIGAENTEFSDLAFYKNARYNKNENYRMLRQYAKDVESGWISPLSGFENYRNLYGRIQTEIVGMAAANGTMITGQVPHFMQRVIGTMVDPEKLKNDLQIIRRSGVEFNEINEAVFSPESIGSVKTRKSGQRSVKLYGKKCIVTINPDTGELIQTNPL